jgi:hypothetical protein
VTAIITSQNKILVTGIVKDISETIDSDLSQIESALSDFKEVLWFLVESDSKDSSVEKLEKLSKSRKNFRYISLGSIQDAGKPRTIGMARARNVCLEEVKSYAPYREVDYVAVSDFNRLNSRLSVVGIRSCFENPIWDACFANQSGRYYDVWALRHPLWSPNDCWQQHAFFRKFYRFPELALNASIRNRMIHIPKNSDWIEVDSAFGGFGIYKRETYLLGSYTGITSENLPICEHVPFHEELRKSGNHLFINPQLINTHSTDHSQRMNLLRTFVRVASYPIKILKRLLIKSRHKTEN